MNTRQKIINKINRIDDPELLREIDKWIGFILDVFISDEFSKAEIAAVHEGYEQYRAGATIDQNEARKLFIEWLKEKTSKQQESANFGYPEGFKELYGSVKDESFTQPDR